MALTAAQKGQITRAINGRSEQRNGKLVLAGAVAMETLAGIDPELHAAILGTQEDPTLNDGILPDFWHVVDIGPEALAAEKEAQLAADEAQAVLDAAATAERQEAKAKERADIAARLRESNPDRTDEEIEAMAMKIWKAVRLDGPR